MASDSSIPDVNFPDTMRAESSPHYGKLSKRSHLMWVVLKKSSELNMESWGHTRFMMS